MQSVWKLLTQGGAHDWSRDFERGERGLEPTLCPHGHYSSRTQLAPGLDLPGLAASCHGYSGADLAALAREAALSALARAALGAGFGAGADASAAGAGPAGAAAEGGSSGSILGAAAAVAGLFGWGAGAGAAQMPEVVVGAEDIAAGMRRVGPSIVRGIEAEVPHTRWVM